MNAPATRPRTLPRRPEGLTKAQTADWFIERATRDGSCLIVTISTNAEGYSRIRYRGTQYRLHRFVLEVKMGRELLAGEQANHVCDRPACINPAHLYAGSHADNMRDRDAAGHTERCRHSMGGGRPRKLTDAQVRAIRARYAAGGTTYRALAVEYGVSRPLVSLIVQRRRRENV